VQRFRGARNAAAAVDRQEGLERVGVHVKNAHAKS
jgi:hypothetical protein